MILEDHISRLAENLEGQVFSPAFPERFLILDQALGNVRQEFPARSVAAPTYTTDLGVRFSRDPSLMYTEHLKIANMAKIQESVLEDTLMNASVTQLDKLLDSLIVFFGNYRVCESVLVNRERELISQAGYKTLIQAGVILGANSNAASLAFFERAEAVADSPDLAYAALHRRAATLIKRFHKPQQAIDLLHRGETSYLEGNDERYRSETAVCLNLKALAEVMLDEPSTAKLMIDEAFAQIGQALKHSRNDPSVYSRAARYRSQIAINRAQMLIKGKDLVHSVDVLKENAAFCGISAPDYLPEAIGELSLSEYRMREYRSSAHHAFLSLNQLRYIGAFSAIHAVRKVLLASLAGMGRADEARALADSYNDDPLGLRITWPSAPRD